MKHLILCPIFICQIWLGYGGTWTVSNNPAIPAQFTSIPAAIASAASGDTILVSGSPTSYSGSITINKAISIIGAGYNPNLGLTTSLNLLIVSRSNVFLSGFKVNQIRLTGQNAPANLIENVTITRCDVALLIVQGLTNNSGSSAVLKRFTVRNNLLEDVTLSGNYSNRYTTLDSVWISNNIFTQFGRIGGANALTGTDKLIVEHNLFIGGNVPNKSVFGDYFFQNYLDNAVIKDNIFYASDPQGCQNCLYFNNLTFQNGANDTLPAPAGNNNIYSQNPLFGNFPVNGASFNYQFDFSLLPNSPAINAASDGTNIGISGGGQPFEIGAPPALPKITDLTLFHTAIPENGSLQIEFKAINQP
ncbi:MAG: hypothetical protein AAFR61_25570 [Bacteroidota bacterium]